MGVFISYSRTSEKNVKWVLEFASRLEKDGIDIVLDEKVLQPGDNLPQFMESILEHEYALIICTPDYKEKADSHKNSVGFETDIIVTEILRDNYFGKIIPILVQGEDKNAIPKYLGSRVFVDLREGTKYEEEYQKLLNVLRNNNPKGSLTSHTVSEIKFDEIKMDKLLYGLLGRAWIDTRSASGESSIIYRGSIFLSENDIKEISNTLDRLEDYTYNENWVIILYRSDIDKVIDNNIWRNGTKVYSYNESERMKAMELCADQIKFRLKRYAGAKRIEYKIYRNGNVGFRYVKNNK